MMSLAYDSYDAGLLVFMLTLVCITILTTTSYFPTYNWSPLVISALSGLSQSVISSRQPDFRLVLPVSIGLIFVTQG